jgi:hypothetical protein
MIIRQKSVALEVLGGKKQVCENLRKAFGRVLKKSAAGKSRETLKGESNGLLKHLWKGDLPVRKGFEIIEFLGQSGENMDRALPILKKNLTTKRQKLIEEQMNQQRSGPCFAGNGTTQFDAGSAISYFIRLQGIEDLCV